MSSWQCSFQGVNQYFPMEALIKLIPSMPFAFAQESVRQTCREHCRTAHHERNQVVAVRPELVEGLFRVSPQAT
jgi:hypothetical protein